MKVLIELPDKWFDDQSPTGFYSYSIRQLAERTLLKVFEEEIIKKTKMPKITISAKELKKSVLDEMAKRAIEQGKYNL